MKETHLSTGAGRPFACPERKAGGRPPVEPRGVVKR